ncbi:glycosyl hydrolase family 61-domain-containing protein [Apodospora peruviana]|uniref:lytic cellulose monooxygenase (C4-dehydrogenating) n=1 Tax=Apodospora peruviana TaxID=516989 RepID=A0AAE0HW73_9PEZI|nr:glycosyl hydrolase family 61-domain-containing protein [Apodospora peruviana]
MKIYLAAFVCATFVIRVLGHQVQGILLVNGTESPAWKYVRNVGPQYEYEPGSYPEGSDFPKTPPQMDINHSDITCGRKAFASAAATETADVLAGSEVGFRVSWDGNGQYGAFWHPGPAQIYLSRAPNDDLEHYEGGDGEWFKIAYAGPVSNNDWLLWPDKHDFNFTIPKATPPGKYLMRFEQWMPTHIFNYSQWYVNCAEVNIIGPGGGTPTGFAKFPGTYDVNHPGLWIPQNQFVNGGFVSYDEMRLLEYTPPGPAVWTG